jgi:hypothetical protein
MITRGTIPAHLEQNVRVNFLKTQKSYAPLRKPFVGETQSSGAYELYGDMGAVPWPILNGGQMGSGGTDERTGAPAAGTISAGENVKIVGGEERAVMVRNVSWDIGIGITQYAIDDGRTAELEDWARGAGSRFEQHKDYLAFNALNTGAATTFLPACYDGQALFSAAHADPGAEYTTAQSNALATALSYTNFKAARVAGSKYRDSRGVPAGLTHNLLIYPSDLIDEAAQIISNPEKAGTGNRDKNPFAGKTRGIEAPGGWLDTTAWFLVDDSTPQKPLYIQNRMAPTLYMDYDPKAADGGVWYFIWRARYTIFPGDWRLVIQGDA